jgi:3',5'-nucleoside bisphosphate phosphatase
MASTFEKFINVLLIKPSPIIDIRLVRVVHDYKQSAKGNSSMKTQFFFKRLLWLIAILLFTHYAVTMAQDLRNEINIPDIPGYITLKCDFHMHTVFSDGNVWPTIRVQEAWETGLDAIAITDHIEWLPHKGDVPPNPDRPYEIAKPRADELGIILIKGAEITRAMPPGHINALFISSEKSLIVETWQEAVKTAVDQGAFVFWNHPGWRQTNEIPIWYDEHSEMLKNGWMAGLEITNDKSYYSLAFQWGLEKHLTLLGDSDVHDPISMRWYTAAGEHRPLTLVFVKECTAESIREALFARRTAVLFNHRLYGEEQYLRPLIMASINLKTPVLSLKKDSESTLQLQNTSDLRIELRPTMSDSSLSCPEAITVPARSTIAVPVKSSSTLIPGSSQITMKISIINAYIAPEKNLDVQFQLTVAKK